MEDIEEIKKAIKYFEYVKNDAVVILESFGTFPHENNLTYRKRKLYAELAIQALKKQVPKKVKRINTNYGAEFRCPECEVEISPVEFFSTDGSEPIEKYSWCWYCGKKIDWSDYK